MTVKDIFDTMDYGPAPESTSEALQWLAERGGIAGHYINGAWGPLRDDIKVINPATGKRIAGLTRGTKAEVTKAVKAARRAQPAWEKSGGPARARHLYALARLLQKHARLFAVLETLDNGKPIRESRDIDVPLAIRHFYFHAGLAQLVDTEEPDTRAAGVCGQIIPWNFPLLMLAWKIAPALAAGCTVVLKPAEYTSLTAMRFAELCTEAGLPKGVVNIVTGDGSTGEALVNAEVDKIAFTGSTAVGRAIREATAGTGKSLTLELGGKSPYIVFDDADIDSAVEGLVDAIWFNQGQVCCAGSRLIVQEGIAEDFYARLRTRMDGLRVGDPLDKCIDVGAIVDPKQLKTITKLISDNPAGDTYVANTPLPAKGNFYPPTLITGLHPADTLMQEEIFGPVLVATTFRTPGEAVEVANNTRYGLAASVWSENINLALDVAPKLAAGIVWVNGTNMMDAAAPFGGVRESGFGREGGWAGLAAYRKPKAEGSPIKPLRPYSGKGAAQTPIDQTAKLFIGGKQTRPDGGYSRAVFGLNRALLGHAPEANRKDLRNAVEAMNAASGWARTTGHLRAQILYYIAENLSLRATELAARIKAMTGQNGAKPVEEAINSLFTFAAWADKYDGHAHGVPLRGVALGMHEPVGKIAAFCDDSRPLVSECEVLGAALAMGNRITLIASEPYPLTALDLSQILETSDVPAGVVNILTGSHTDLAPHAGGHADIDAVWSFSSSDISTTIERESAHNLKQTWVTTGRSLTPTPKQMLAAATEIKTVWIPYGE